MTHFDKCLTHDCGILSIFEGTSNFAFSSGGYDVFKNLTKIAHRTIDTWISFGKSRKIRCKATEEEVATNSAFSARFYKTYLLL